MTAKTLCCLMLMGIGLTGWGCAWASDITGIVLDVNGDAVKGAIVTVAGQDIETKTSSKGTFKLKKVTPGPVFLSVATPSEAYLSTETKKALVLTEENLKDVQIVLSGRPGPKAEYVGIENCKSCHEEDWGAMFHAFDGSPSASSHSRFVDPGTDRMIYPEMWPAPGEAFLPRSPKGELLMVQDPLDGEG